MAILCCILIHAGTIFSNPLLLITVFRNVITLLSVSPPPRVLCSADVLLPGVAISLLCPLPLHACPFDGVLICFAEHTYSCLPPALHARTVYGVLNQHPGPIWLSSALCQPRRKAVSFSA